MATLAASPSLHRQASFYNVGTGGHGELLAIHRGAIDTTTITTKPPHIAMASVRKVLLELGLQVQEESPYQYRCIRASRTADASDEGAGKGLVTYGPPTEDPGDEVRLSVELTRLEGLSDTYSLDIRRLRGNLRSYKFLYETIRDKTALSR